METKNTINRRHFIAGTGLLLTGYALNLQGAVAQPSEPIIDIHQHTDYAGRSQDKMLAHQRMMGVTTTILLPGGRPLNYGSTHYGVSNGLQVKAGGNEVCYQYAKDRAPEMLFGACEVPDFPGAIPELEKYLSGLEDLALSVVIVGHKPHDGHSGEVLAVFALGDKIKANAKEAVHALHAAGVEKVIVLSGDNQKTVDAIRLLSGIDEGIGDLLPEDKVEHVKALTLKYKNVAMVGDGINDAPALAHASVGISMGAAGTDAAIETSDVALMQDDLAELPKAIKQGRRVLSIIRFNIGFALATKVIFLILAVLGYSNLWLAVVADLGASIFVTINALRLLRVKADS